MTAEPYPNTTPQDQFRDDVLPPYEAYKSDMGCEWKARAAAAAVAHFTEHVWVYYDRHDRSQLHGARTPEDYVDYLANQCSELKILWDFALSIKHRILTQNPEVRIVTSATDALEPNDGRQLMRSCGRHFDNVLDKAVNYWRERLPTLRSYS